MRQTIGGNLRLTVLPVLLLAVASVLLACSDNSTKLSHAIERASRAPTAAQAGSIMMVPYRPKRRPAEPYVLIFFPESATNQGDLVAAGIDEALASRIFSDLVHVHVGHGPLLVVYQEGEPLTFTAHWSQFAFVEKLLVLRGSGTRNIRLEKWHGRMMILGLD